MHIYRDIIKTSWRTLWRYPWLWPFGFFAALIGNGGEYGSVITAIDRVARQGDLITGIREALLNNRMALVWQRLEQSLAQAPFFLISTLFLMLIILLIIVWLIITSQAALIKTTADIEDGAPTSFTAAATQGNKHFWSILILNILSRFIIWLLLAVSIMPFFIAYLAQGGAMEFDSLIIISFLIFVPLSFIISFIIKYAIISVILDKQGWWLALVKAINLFFRNWLVSLEMAAILFGINLLLGVIIYSLVANNLLSAPLIIALSGFNLATALKLLPPIMLIIVGGALFSVFQYVSWTLLYRRLVYGQVMPKLLRAVDDIPTYLEKWFQNTPRTLPKPKQSNR